MNSQSNTRRATAVVGVLIAIVSISLTQTPIHALSVPKPVLAATATPVKKAVELLPQPKSGFPPGIAPESARVDLVKPSFTNPGSITNPLLPYTKVDQIIQVGQKDGLPHRTELTLLPGSTTVNWLGQETKVRTLQFVAYLDGHILETAIDYLAQADDGAVWYFGEDVNNYVAGKVETTEGTWHTGKDVSPAMIMPVNPKVGTAYRIENIPGTVFEEATIKAINQTLEGPRGLVTGVMFVEQIGMNGKSAIKAFVPGYGEFLAHTEDAAVALPTDALSGPMPNELKALLTGATDLLSAPEPKDWQVISRTLQTMTDAWDAYNAGKASDKFVLLNTQFDRAFTHLIEGSKELDIRDVHKAAFDVAVAAVDLQMPYRSVVESDLTRLMLWSNRTHIDSLEAATSDVAGDIVVIDLILGRVGHQLDAAIGKDLTTRISAMKKASSAQDMTGVAEASTTLSKIVSTLSCKPNSVCTY